MIPNIPHLKKYHHHCCLSLSPTAWLYGINSHHLQEPLCDGLVEVAVEGFIRFFESAKKKKYLAKASILI